MSFASNTPITAGSASDYTRTFKKHFGDRPTAFALSERTVSPSTSACFSSPSSAGLSRASSSASFHNTIDEAAARIRHGNVWDPKDPFAAASTNATRGEGRVEGRGNVDESTHNALQNLGWRIRSRINQGYTRSSSSVDPFGTYTANSGGLGVGPGFVSERDILANVTNGRRCWSRVKTAPCGAAATFDELRKSVHHGVGGQEGEDERMETEDTHAESSASMSTGGVPKRSRARSEEVSDDEQLTPHENGSLATAGLGGNEGRRIKALPQLSFSSSTSSSTTSGSVFGTSPTSLPPAHPHFQPQQHALAPPSGRAPWGRSTNSATSPFASETTVASVGGDEEDIEMSTNHNLLQEEDHFGTATKQDYGSETGYDFSSHFNCTDF